MERKPKKCEVCKSFPTCICFMCMSYYCDSCFNLSHENEEYKAHDKDEIDSFLPIDVKCPIHTLYPMGLFCVNEKELCCPLCVFLGLHRDHRILKIEEEELLRKENICIENSLSDLRRNIRKLNEFKSSVEQEIQEIDNDYETVDKEVTQSFEKKRENLKKEEENLKERLKNEVKNAKEKLEIYLTEINSLLNISEKLENSTKSIENEEKSMIKILSYVSHTNENQKEMNKLFNKLMKNIKISFIEEKSIINYENYYFNGIPFPNNIEFKEIRNTSFKLTWKIEDTKILNIDRQEIKYRIAIRKMNSNEEFKNIYEGNENSYIVGKLTKNTSYEIRICSVYKNIISEWSKIQIIETQNIYIDSVILNTDEVIDEFVAKLSEWTGYSKMELLYRGTRDGSNSDTFHDHCDDQGPTVILCKIENNNIFGGYAPISWGSDNKYHAANGSFLFTLTNIYKIPPTKFPNTQSQEYAVYHNIGYGPTFGAGNDLCISNDYLNNNDSYISIGFSYPDVVGKGNSIFVGDAKTNNFKLKELEVFLLSGKRNESNPFIDDLSKKNIFP